MMRPDPPRVLDAERESLASRESGAPPQPALPVQPVGHTAVSDAWMQTNEKRPGRLGLPGRFPW
ncbi:MAG: hypothetical protein JWO79_93 [Actinomycetia bacterium]|nr:hypothetical protein [Actinomycetes bacterium]